MAASDLIPALQTAVDTFNATADADQVTIDAKVTSANTQDANAKSAYDGAVTAKDTAQRSLDNAYRDTSSARANVDYQNLEALALNKSVTAVDVFVYDTSLDSDGGAWRNRCSKLSWYKEPLNTSTRGSRREFPSVAVIVAEATKVTIYDGDDPALPMWMVFNGTTDTPTYQLGFYMPSGTTHQITAVTAKERNVVFGISSGSSHPKNGMCVVDFGSDNLARWHNSPATSGGTGLSVGERHDVKDLPSRLSEAIVNNIVNDVAMTVLPDAPIAPATGLPVPTIAVGCGRAGQANGGTSIIHNDGTVVDLSANAGAGGYATYALTFGKNNELITMEAYGGAYSHICVFDQLPTSDVSSIQAYASRVYSYHTSIKVPSVTGNGNPALIELVGTDSIYAGYTNRLTHLLESKLDKTKGMIAYTTSEYNTGYQVGDIKGAFLADTNDTDLEDTELVTNGTFDTDLTGWTNLTNATWVSGAINCANGTFFQSNVFTGAKTVRLTFDQTVNSGTRSRVRLRNAAGNADVGPFSYYNGSGTQTIEFSTSDGLSLWFLVESGADVTFDNISVVELDADRSVNANGLTVNGTVTRSPVATGAELVGYSGFNATGVESTSSFLKQPYNSDLDFGTGEFAIVWWENKTVAATRYQMDRKGSTNTGKWTVYSDVNNRLNFFAYDQLGYLINGTKTATNGSTINTWVMNAIVRDSGGTLHFYLNGSHNGSHAFSGDITDTNADAVLDVGNRWDHANAWSGSLALLRISATAPTADQIKKIYEDERMLFQENAACTLYGSSDAVTALSHDPVTNLLHVGTSAGRSDFQGLRRVNNTTTGVGSAISSVNGMVVEE